MRGDSRPIPLPAILQEQAEAHGISLHLTKQCGQISLNRTKALNALNLPMVQVLRIALHLFERMDECHHILITSGLEKAFCAGGDVRQVIADKLSGNSALSYAFFHEEYHFNRELAECRKPTFAVVDGLALGGGLGLCGHTRYCVVSEKAQMAMPEMKIGLFPDVGALHFWRKGCSKAMARYLALTGARLDAASALQLKLASHYISSAHVPQLIEQIIDYGETALMGLPTTAPAQNPSLPAAQIDACFASDHLGEIEQKLLTQQSPEHNLWASEALAALSAGCPFSQVLTLEHIKRHWGKPLRKILQADYALAKACVDGPNFAEGVRALLIDKDQQPNWQPAHWPDVTQQDINACFTPAKEW